MARETAIQLDYVKRGRRLAMRGWMVRAVVAAALVLAVRLGALGWDHAMLLRYQAGSLAHRAEGSEVIFDGARSVAVSDWEKFYARFSPPGSRHAATAFVGELRREGGKARLVAVEVGPEQGMVRGLRLVTTVIEPGWAWGRPRLIRDWAWVAPIERREGQAIRVRAGVRDAQNAAHFTIAIETGGTTRIVDGYLQADDRVTLELREERVGTALGN